jgi:hypothetical protein
MSAHNHLQYLPRWPQRRVVRALERVGQMLPQKVPLLKERTASSMRLLDPPGGGWSGERKGRQRVARVGVLALQFLLELSPGVALASRDYISGGIRAAILWSGR